MTNSINSTFLKKARLSLLISMLFVCLFLSVPSPAQALNFTKQEEQNAFIKNTMEAGTTKKLEGEALAKFVADGQKALKAKEKAEAEFFKAELVLGATAIELNIKLLPEKYQANAQQALREAQENIKAMKDGKVLKGAFGMIWSNVKLQFNNLGDAVGTFLDVGDNVSNSIQSYIFNDKKSQAQDLKDNMLSRFRPYVGKYISQTDFAELEQQVNNFVAIGERYENELAKYNAYTETNGLPVYVHTDESGRQWYFVLDEDEIRAVKGAGAGCMSIPAKMAESKSCLFCPLFEVIYKAADTMATTSYAKMGRPMAMVMLIGLAIYIAFKVMILTSGFVKQDAPKFITETLTQSFKILVAYILLYNGQQIYIYAISPVLGSGLEFGTAILSEGYSKYISSCGTGGAFSTGMLGGALYAKLVCFIQGVQAEIYVPQAIGSSLMCVAFGSAAKIQNFIPNFSMVFVGLIIWGFAWLVMLAFGFYLIDATIRIGIVGALMPFLIATWPFKATSKYASTGWGMILNTFFVYVFLGIVIAVNVTLMKVSLGDSDAFNEIINLMNGDKVTALREKLEIGFSGFLVLIIGCLFGFKLTAQSASLAGSFAGGGGPDLAPKIGGLMASGATGVGKWVGGKAFSGGKRALESTGLGEKYRTARDGIKRGMSRAVSGVFGGGNPGKSNTKPATPTTGPSAGAGGIANNQTPKQQGENTQQQQTSGTGGTNPNNGAPKANNNAPQGGNLSPQNNVDNAVNAGPRGSENATPQGLNHLAQAHMDSYKAYLDSYKNDKNQSATDMLAAQKSAQALNDFKNNASIDEQAKKSTLPNFVAMDALNQNKAAASQEAMKDSAIRAYSQKKQFQAMSQGKSFDAQKVEDFANENFDEVLKELDSDLGKEE